MAGIAVDNLLHAATRRVSADGSVAVNCLARFIVTKHSWRGKYRRVLCVTPTSLFTQHPENLQVTNIWSFVDDPDIDGIVVPPEAEGEHELILSCRNDKKVRADITRHAARETQQAPQSKFKPLKLTCKHRATLLSILYQLLSAAAQRGATPTAARILGCDVCACSRACVSHCTHRGSPTEFSAHKLRRGSWVPVVLRITPWALERLDPATGALFWVCTTIMNVQ